VKVAGIEGNYTVIGEAKVYSGILYFSVEVGDTTLMNKKIVKLRKNAPS